MAKQKTTAILAVAAALAGAEILRRFFWSRLRSAHNGKEESQDTPVDSLLDDVDFDGFHEFESIEEPLDEELQNNDQIAERKQVQLCKNCKCPGHFARNCPYTTLCNNCRLPGHIATECTLKSLCFNCMEPGHKAINCSKEGICCRCGLSGHPARDCCTRAFKPGEIPRICTNCFRMGHDLNDCTNAKACKNCRKTDHLAFNCRNTPICNSCNLSGHMAFSCPKTVRHGLHTCGPSQRDINRGRN